jgi:sugar phosphate isomerase/epimerase
MKFGISNLSWESDNDSYVRKHLVDYDYIETIFPRIDYGYYSTQSIFYSSDVQSFDDFESTLKRINFVIDECHKYGIKIIVLGSPSLRKGNKKNLNEVFKIVNSKLQEYDIFLCVEPNSSYYGGDYYFSLSEIVDDIQYFSNVKTMIDSHNLILENEDLFDQYEKYHTQIKHCHFSEKDLNPIKDYSLYYKFVDFLKNKQYNYGITYELKTTNNIVEDSNKFISLKKELYEFKN